MRHLEIRKMVIEAFLLALCIIVPLLFHQIPQGGNIFLPMHIPVLLSGFILGPIYGLMTGLLGPLLSFSLTGMPTLFVLPGMMIELACYGLFSGLFYRIYKTKYYSLDVFLTLLTALIIGKAVRGIFDTFYYSFNSRPYSFMVFFTSYLVTAWPGLLFQVVFIPTLMISLNKMDLLLPDNRSLATLFHLKNSQKKNEERFKNIEENKKAFSNVSDPKIQEILVNLPLNQNLNLLDIGGGTGSIARILAPHFKTVTTLESVKEVYEEGKKTPFPSNVTYLNQDFYFYQTKEKYDVILFFNSYPHFENKALLPYLLSNLLTPHGKIYILSTSSKERINEINKKEVLKSPIAEAEIFLKDYSIVKEEEDDNFVLVLERRY